MSVADLQVLGFFRQLSRAVSEPFFLQTILLVLISSPASRLSALNYLAKELQKPPDPSLGVENGLINRGVAAVLNDENVLVRRNGLDLLLRVLRIHEAIFKCVYKYDAWSVADGVTGKQTRASGPC